MVSIKLLAKITTETDKSEISRISDCHNSWKKNVSYWVLYQTQKKQLTAWKHLKTYSTTNM